MNHVISKGKGSDEIDLLSLIYCGMDFQIEAPSYIKPFFISFVFGFGKRIELELSRRLWFNISVLKVNNYLNIALAFILSCCFSGSHPNIFSTVC